MEVIVKDSIEEMSILAARTIADVIHKKPDAVLGLTTGKTPEGTYVELIKLYEDGELDFSEVTTFNLDEYVGLSGDHEQSFRYFMNERFFNHINIDKARTYVPDGLAEDIERSCELYEWAVQTAGGIDIQVLGIGSNGHIAFNEPGSSLGSRTRVKTLDEKTISDNAMFFDRIEDVPRYAITMGVGTIMDSKRLILLAYGENKAEAIAKTVEGPITAQVPATMVQMHRQATIIIDRTAASLLKGQYPDEPAKINR